MRRDTWWVLVAGNGLESHPHEQPARVTMTIAPVVRGGASPARPPQRSPARRCKWRVAAGIVAAVVGGVVRGEGRRCGAGVAAVGDDEVERVMWFVLERNHTQQQTDGEMIRDHTRMHGSERLWCRTRGRNSYECFSCRDAPSLSVLLTNRQ